jgi:hypothetical protein
MFRTNWIRSPLLLTLLAFVGMAGDWHVWRSGPALAAAGAIDPLAVELAGGVIAPGQTPWISVVGTRGFASGVLHAGTGPSPDRNRPGLPLPNGSPGMPSDLVAVRLRVAAFARLAFAHDATLLRYGAYSAFGTTLPPPVQT